MPLLWFGSIPSFPTVALIVRPSRPSSTEGPLYPLYRLAIDEQWPIPPPIKAPPRGAARNHLHTWNGSTISALSLLSAPPAPSILHLPGCTPSKALFGQAFNPTRHPHTPYISHIHSPPHTLSGAARRQRRRPWGAAGRRRPAGRWGCWTLAATPC